MSVLPRIRKLLAASLLLALVPLHTFALAKDGIAAVVDDHIITLAELNNNIAIAKGHAESSGVALPSMAMMKKQVLDLMIDNRLQLQMAKQQGIDITDQELSETIANIAKQKHFTETEFKAALKEDHVSFDTFKQNIKEQMIIQKLVGSSLGRSIVVTDDEVTQWWQKVQQDMVKYDVMDYWQPAEGQQALNKARRVMQGFAKQLEEGTSAERLLEDPVNHDIQKTAMSGRTLAQLPDIFASEISDLVPHKSTVAIKADNGYHVLVLKAKSGSLSKNLLRKKLFMQKLEEKRGRWLKQMRDLAYIKVNV